MAWTFTSAVRHGNVGVTVNAANGDDAQSWCYSYPMYLGQTAKQFKAAVRKEIRAHLDHLNMLVTDTNVDADYSDL